ncbi:uncharacterized protein LOC129583111 [Paramacrobiotus metropolitanus]|uniref:uncharacterized protein LOC129583111 n=1 Tax=Paramacrobiotus metropolitanus TaxID=2943436 RepID=UPI0024458873|nr:uncharacterized protein LOC129583111 [Paramacrobiotus metropolitanus]
MRVCSTAGSYGCCLLSKFRQQYSRFIDSASDLRGTICSSTFLPVRISRLNDTADRLREMENPVYPSPFLKILDTVTVGLMAYLLLKFLEWGFRTFVWPLCEFFIAHCKHPVLFRRTFRVWIRTSCYGVALICTAVATTTKFAMWLLCGTLRTLSSWTEIKKLCKELAGILKDPREVQNRIMEWLAVENSTVLLNEDFFSGPLSVLINCLKLNSKEQDILISAGFDPAERLLSVRERDWEQPPLFGIRAANRYLIREMVEVERKRRGILTDV